MRDADRQTLTKFCCARWAVGGSKVSRDTELMLMIEFIGAKRIG
jgi:hypothetical protein